jgi:hypothetical protein
MTRDRLGTRRRQEQLLQCELPLAQRRERQMARAGRVLATTPAARQPRPELDVSRRQHDEGSRTGDGWRDHRVHRRRPRQDRGGCGQSAPEPLDRGGSGRLAVQHRRDAGSLGARGRCGDGREHHRVRGEEPRGVSPRGRPPRRVRVRREPRIRELLAGCLQRASRSATPGRARSRAGPTGFSS